MVIAVPSYTFGVVIQVTFISARKWRIVDEGTCCEMDVRSDIVFTIPTE